MHGNRMRLAAASCQHLRGTLMAITRYSHSSAHQSPSTRSRCARATPLAAAAVAPALAGIQALFELLVVAAYPSAAAAAARRRQSQSTHSRCSRRRCLHSSAAGYSCIRVLPSEPIDARLLVKREPVGLLLYLSTAPVLPDWQSRGPSDHPQTAVQGRARAAPSYRRFEKGGLVGGGGCGGGRAKGRS